MIFSKLANKRSLSRFIPVPVYTGLILGLILLAAYNAGPGVVQRWVEREEGREIEEFIEDIPYRETRNYVKKVLAYYEAYRRLHGSEGS